MTNTGSELTSLFQAQPMGRRRYPALALSSALHSVGIVMVSWALLHNPVVIADPLTRNYKVRHLQLDPPEAIPSQTAESLYPTHRAGDNAARSAAHPRSTQAMALPQGGSGRQILVQPDMSASTTIAAEVPLPTVLLWTAPAKAATEVVPPTPEKPGTTNVQPTLQLPNDEQQLANLPQKSSDRTPVITTPPPGTGTPIATKGPAEAQASPSTLSKPASQPAPAAILSITDLRMDKGTVVLPPVNETKGNSNKHGVKSAPPGTALAQNGIGNPSHATGSRTSSLSVADEAESAENGAAEGESAEHIHLPQDGRFGVVVVGSSVADQYPETFEVWSDRVAYTAYLHVGTPKAWILQYAQLRSADAAAAGAVAHLDAPWPYDILRPNLLSKDLNADALMVHGVLNEAGRLVNLAIAYPQGYVHSSFVLHELEQWKFRPAQQRGQPTPVEVLLIIPENE